MSAVVLHTYVKYREKQLNNRTVIIIYPELYLNSTTTYRITDISMCVIKY